MRGKAWVASLLVGLALLLWPQTASAQECKYVDGDIGERFIVIDGETYEYISIEESKRRLTAMKQNEALRSEIALKDEKIAVLEDTRKNLEAQNGILRDASSLDRELIGKLIGAGYKPATSPFLRRPVVNFIGGYLLSSLTYTAWLYATGKLSSD